MSKISGPVLGVIIPTLLEREDLLLETINSALKCQPEQIVIVSTKNPSKQVKRCLTENCKWVVSNADLPRSIVHGVSKLRPSITHFTWVGDDDLLIPEYIRSALNSLDDRFLCVGYSDHIDVDRKHLWTQRPSAWRITLTGMTLFSSPISQPASIIKLSSYLQIGGIDSRYKLAFDQDLFTRLIRNFGTPFIFRFPIAKVRVHQDSLSRKLWQEALRESSEIRVRNARAIIRPLTVLLNQIRVMLLSFSVIFRGKI